MGDAFAAPAAGRVVYAIGVANALESGGSSRPLKRGSQIFSGDRIVTGSGRVQMRLTDGSFVAVKANTQYAITEYNFDGGDDGSERSFFNLIRGGVRFVTGAIGRKNKQNWRLNTVVATIGIRGSAGNVIVDDNDNLDFDVEDGEFFAVHNATGVETDFSNDFQCDAGACSDSEGPGDAPPADTFFSASRPSQNQDGANEGNNLNTFDSDGPIPSGSGAEGIHLSTSFGYRSGGIFLFGHPRGAVLGETINGTLSEAEFGSLLSATFDDDGLLPCNPCVFNSNGAEQTVDPTDSGATFNTELGAEWGRVLEGWSLQSNASGPGVVEFGHYHWVASNNETPSSAVPTTGMMTYSEDLGGTLATHTVGTTGEVEVATGRSSASMTIDFGLDIVYDFRVSASFPSGSNFVLQSNMPTAAAASGGYLDFPDFNGAQTQIIDPRDGCAGGCTLFAETVFGYAGDNAQGITGAFWANSSTPAHAVQGTFVLGVQP
ncbi:MAG: FecR family protein [Pseudomonadota bacterium]